ncbi:MAG: T9SS type A sorting domain-containing protein, partial [Candidatus Cloacimonetes bacterium]|nr:T9SS type A sorting domain-containing protein [Candidatus Cloacimonadota bacterium]
WNDWADYVMMGIIRDSLLAYTYTEVDQIYDPGAYASQVTTAINDGRSTVNYCGHGSTTSWGTTGFSNSNVNALVNDNMLPFIITVACLNGQFQNTTCFAEAWLRATNSSTGEPTGAIGMYASTIGQPWEPPMPAEYEANMLLVHEEKNTYGGLCFNGSMFMMDVCPIEGPDVFEHWTLFGDPSLQVRTDIPTQMTVEHNPIILIGSTTYDVEVVGVQGALVGLYMNDLLYGYGYTDENGYVTVELIEDLFEPGVMTITVTAYNKIPYITTIDVIGSGYFDISGYVGYYSNADPVQNTSVTLTESGTYSTTTTTNGDYLFNDIPSGSYISTPSKADNLGGLSGTDASRIARYAAGLYSFDCLEIIAGDVSMNGYISGMDASRVARYIAGLITELNDDGIEWVFTPEPIPECNYWPPIVYENTREYSPLNLDLTEEDFIGIRLGDVSGNWSPDSRVVLTSESFEAIELDININSILKIPIVIENITDIEGIDIEIAFNPEVLQLTGLSLNEGILNNKDYGVETNLEEPGQGTMVIYALRDLVSESGVVAFIEFDVIGDEGSSSEIYFTKFDVNETEASGGFQIGDSEGNEVVTRRLEVNVVQALPDKFALYQNYPNPFSRTTLIRYDLPQDTYVNIQIYNVRGQLVKELVNGVETAGRKHIEWDTEGMSSGIYFYRLSTKDKTFIKKMVLMR